MSCKIDRNLSELIDKMETMFSSEEIRKMEEKALKPVAEKIKIDMKGAAPNCDESEPHGKDSIGLRFVKSRGYVVGLDNQMKDNKGDYWENIRGLWFSQWGGGNNYKHLGWFTKFARSNGNKYLEESKEELLDVIEEKLNKL